MNIQDTINELGLQEVQLPNILGQRVGAVKDLQNKVELATKEVEENGTDENKDKLKEIEEYLDEYYKDAVEQLKNFAKKHKEEQETAKEEQETAKVESENTPKAEVKDEVKLKTEQKEATEKQTESVEAEPQKEKSNGGLGALLIGGVILVATLGAVNIMRNR